MIERDPIPVPPRRRGGSSARRRILIVAAIVLVALVLSLRGLATFWTDYLWFDSVGFGSVWSTLLVTRIVLVVVATVVAASLLFGNLVLADRLSPRTMVAAGSPDEELIQRFQEWVRPRITWLRLAVSGFFGLLIGLGAGAWWEDWLLFTNRESFGVADPVFNNDVGFYVFSVPFYRDLFAWGFQFVLITTLIVAALHYLNGGILIGGNARERISGGVKVHLSVLLAILAMLKALGYWLDQFDLLYSTRGFVTGASYTDVTAQLPAIRLLIFISLFAALLLLVNIRFRGWILPAAAVGLWLVTSFVVGFIIPEAVQRFSVEPDEISKELPYVERNIEFTREAFGLDDIELRPFAANDDLDGADIAANAPTIDNVRLWDPTVVITTFQQLQELRPFYQFDDVDVDRYDIGGQLTQVMLAARELDPAGVPEDNWVNQHLVYTHGYGSVVSSANTVTVDGQPDFFVRDINPDDGAPGSVRIDQPRVYFGDAAELDSFLIVGTEEQEVDFPLETAGAETVAFNSYDGEGGVEVGGFFRRMAFALRFADINTLISGQIGADSRVLMVRNIRDRFTKAAPFLSIDADPYLAIVDGRLVWIVDMYTVTDRYPYSSSAQTARLGQKSGLRSGFNYIRNSVKGTIDAYDGTMTLYVVDEDDAILRSYRRIFPSLFTPGDEMSDDLRAHLRYPEDLFRVQTDMYARYHMTEPRVFFNNGDPWQIARDPSTTPGEVPPGPNRLMVPYYLLLELPDEDDLSYVLLQPFTAEDRPNMVSFMIAKSDPDEYGEMINFEVPRDAFVDGPGQVGARINQNPDIAREFTLLGQEGSEVIQGNMLVVPIEESIVYIQPIYIRSASSEAAALPEFKRVVVVFGDRIVMRETLAGSLAAVFGDAPPSVVEPGGEEPLPDDVLALLQQADEAFQRADAALRAGDLGAYADEIAEAQRLVAEAQSILEGEDADTAPASG